MWRSPAVLDAIVHEKMTAVRLKHRAVNFRMQPRAQLQHLVSASQSRWAARHRALSADLPYTLRFQRQMKMKLPQLSKPLRMAIAMAAWFVFVTLLVLIFQSLLHGEVPKPLEPAEVIALITGAITAAGLAGLFFQVQDISNQAEHRAEESRRQTAVRLDALHEFFSSSVMRKNRNMGYAFLKYLLAEGNEQELEGYATYWTLDVDYNATVPTKEKLLTLHHEHGAPEFSSSDPRTDQLFEHYDAAASAMVAFFVRLSLHLRDAIREDESYEDAYLQSLRDSVGPFFWTYYWSRLLLPLADACEYAFSHQDSKLANTDGKSTRRYGQPAFISPLRRLDRLMRVLEPPIAPKQLSSVGDSKESPTGDCP